MQKLAQKEQRIEYSGDLAGSWGEGLNTYSGWYMMDCSSTAKPNRLCVEGATEYHPAFRKALQQINAERNLNDYSIDFDGNILSVSEVLSMPPVDLSEIKWFHGTSVTRWEEIQKSGGLKPRSETGINDGYGSNIPGIAQPRSDAVYLTVEIGMARWASIDAANATKSKRIILQIDPLFPQYMIPDPDSRQRSAEDSLAVMGSVGYTRSIPISLIKVYQTY